MCNSSADGDVMTCLTPDLSILANTTTHSAADWPLVASVSFIMDAVGGLPTNTTPELMYFEDPVVQQFDSSSGRVRYFYDDDIYLEIEVCLVCC